MNASRHAVAVLAADPELVRDLDPAVAGIARRHAVAESVRLDRGRNPEWPRRRNLSEASGLLVVEGLLLREVRVAGRSCAELIGAGDLIRPWDADGELAPVSTEVAWTALEPTELAILDRRFMASVGRWPEVVEAILARTIRRTQSLAKHLAISHLTRVEDRILVLLWHLADRWGRVRPDGVMLPMRLTHEMLGKLVGARRPSVTTAVNELIQREAIARADGGGWLLLGSPPGDLGVAVDQPDAATSHR